MDNSLFYRQALEELRKRYSRKEVSLLIGAGFSRNAYSKFPLWGDLLKDMVSDIYHNEIYSSYQTHHHINKNSFQNFSDFASDKIWEIIQREGYLDVVSQYINKKGFRESIECYIEERIPRIDWKSGILSTKKPLKSTKLDKTDLIVHKKVLEGNWDSIFTTNYDQLLEYTADLFHKSWSTVVDARDLSFCKQTQSIIKLHGDLCSEGDEDFAFDGNFNHRYIISKEDYEEYPKHHEAFTQLMRISLLQGTFCLMGFSGDDPNFISWIKWVRDILTTRRKKTGSKTPMSEIRIFLIDISDTEPSYEKILFYRNHNICYIPLRNKYILKIINASKLNYPIDLKNLIISFLEYIYGIENIETKYNECWYKLEKQSKINGIDLIDNDIYEEIKYLRQDINLVLNPSAQKWVLFRILNSKNPSSEVIDLCQWAMADLKYLPEDFGDLYPNFINFPRTSEQDSLYHKLLEREDTLRKPFNILLVSPEEDEISDWKHYENSLRKSFVFDFSGLKSYLSEWDPDIKFKIFKANLYSLFDRKTACDLILTAIDSIEDMTDKYTMAQLYNVLSKGDILSTSAYENLDLKSNNIIINELVKGLENEKNNKEIKEYGNRTESHTITSKPSNYECSIRLFQTLLDFPMPLLRTYIKPDVWLKLFRELYEHIPYPVVFYSIVGYDEKMSTRIGQELAFSDSLYKNKLPEILDRLISGYKSSETPQFIRPKLLRVSKELLISVKPDKWESSFMDIWKTRFINVFNRIDEHFDKALIEFIYKGLELITQIDNRITIVNDCLRFGLTNLNLTINILFYLNVRKDDYNETTYILIDDILNKMSSIQEFTILGNLYPLIENDNDIIKRIVDKANNFLDDNTDDLGLYAIASFMGKINYSQDNLKKNILSHRKLWDNGIMETGASIPNFLLLNRFFHSIRWSDKEVLIIYDKMVESYNQLVKSRYFNEDESPLIHFRYDLLLREMRGFYIHYKNILIPDDKREDFYKNLTSSFYKKSGFVSVVDALFLNNAGIVIRGLNELYQQINMDGIKNHINDLLVLMDRILFQKSAALGECIEYLSFYTKKWLQDIGLLPKSYRDKLKMILSLFSVEIFRDLESDVPKCTFYMCQLAETVKDIKGLKMSAKPWIEVFNSGRFNFKIID